MYESSFRQLIAFFEKYTYTCADRPALSDADFHQRFYANSEVTPETCAGGRRMLCEQLRMCNTLPDDNVAHVFGDVDIAEVCLEIGEEFGVTFTDEVLHRIDGTSIPYFERRNI